MKCKRWIDISINIAMRVMQCGKADDNLMGHKLETDSGGRETVQGEWIVLLTVLECLFSGCCLLHVNSRREFASVHDTGRVFFTKKMTLQDGQAYRPISTLSH